MNQLSQKTRWLLWGLIEILLVGGYLLAENFLPPLLPKLLPAEWKNLGWCGLHAALQLVQFHKLFTPLLKERLTELYPDLSPRAMGWVMHLTYFSLGRVLFLGFLYFAKSKPKGTPAPFLIRNSGFTAIFLVIIIVGGLGFTPLEKLVATGLFQSYEQIHTFSNWTSSPTVLSISDLTHTIEKASSVEEAFEKTPEEFYDSSARLKAYQAVGISPPIAAVLLLVLENKFMEKERTRANANLEPEFKSNIALNLGEGVVGIFEELQNSKPLRLQVNPILLLNTGAAEVFMLEVLGARGNVINKTGQIQLTQLLAVAKKRESTPPNVAARIEALEKRVKRLFPVDQNREPGSDSKED
jgi:hypothetical protein